MDDPNMMAALNGQAEPQQPQTSAGIQDALMGWMRAAYGVAAIGPKAIRDAATKANSSYAGMVNNTLAKRKEEALKNRYEWEQNTRLLLDLNQRRLGEYGKVWSSPGPIEQKMQQITDIAARWGDKSIGSMAQNAEQYTTFGGLYDQLQKGQQQLQQSTTALDGQIKQIEKRMGVGGGGSGQLPPISGYMNDDLPA